MASHSQNEHTKGDSTSERLLRWLQIIAICGAAFWAVRNFSLLDAPGLEPRIRVQNNASLSSGWDNNSCQMNYIVTIYNEGKTSFDVNRVHVNAWWSPLPQLRANDGATPIELATFQNPQRQILNQDMKDSVLLKHFAPGESNDQGFAWQLPKFDPVVIDINVEVDTNEHGLVGHGDNWFVRSCRADHPSQNVTNVTNEVRK